MRPYLHDLHEGNSGTDIPAIAASHIASCRPEVGDRLGGLVPEGLGDDAVRSASAGVAQFIGDLCVGVPGCLQLDTS